MTTSAAVEPIDLHDFEPEVDSFREEVVHGLQQAQKTIPCKYFYDAHGSHLFDQICELDEYYPTRTELSIMQQHAGAMAQLIGRGCLLIEYGSGSSLKTRVLLDHLQAPAAYVPIDISREHLMRSAAGLAAAYPSLKVLPVCADYTADFTLPLCHRPIARKVVYFPGSTIGNFDPVQAQKFLCHIAAIAGAGGGLLIGIDLKKDARILEPAYNDAKGVTAAFNLNLLHRINRELGADFQLHQFRHHAFYNEELGRIEMHLVSLQNQTVQIGETTITFTEDETIHTENSYKYSPEEFAVLAANAGFELQAMWTDEQRLFGVQYLTTI
jgi:dimethylhistidine N-methyltransferase